MFDQKAYEKRYYETHRKEKNIYVQKWRKNNPGKVKGYNQTLNRRECANKYYRKQKGIILAHYGMFCSCCGETRREFLQIDHINGGGNKHRKENNIHGSMYRWLIKNNFPEGFRVLCANCNASKGAFGYCPHEKERSENYDYNIDYQI